MKRTSLVAGLGLSLLMACWACGRQVSTATNPQSNSNQANPTGSGELRFKAPDAWVTEKTTSSMRMAQYRVPRAEDDKEDASLVLYFFGATQGGTAQANIDRWIGQMQQADGSDSKARAKTENLTINGLKVSTVDVTGTYTAEMAPGSKTFHNDAEYRLRAAVIETPKGNYFVKLAGPAKTVAHWDQAYNDYLKSFEFK